MSEHSSPRDGACVDDLELQLIVDGELEGSPLELAHLHLIACTGCSERLRALREQAVGIQELLGCEDEAGTEDAAAVLARVEEAVRRAVQPAPRPRRSFIRRFGFGIAASAAVLALLIVWQAGDDLTAAPGRILDEAIVREQAWMYRPGKVLHWVVESDISGSSRLADGHYRTEHWLSTVAGAEGAILRRMNAEGRLVFATWRRHDGSVVSYRTSRSEPLQIEPATAEIESQLAAISREERRTLQAFLDRRAQDSELSIQGSRFAKWFLDAANSRGGARAQRISTPSGRDGYYLRVERGPGAPLDRGVVRMVIETYIEAEGFRRYRLRTQRDLADGRQWIEDARWTEFNETDMASFEANTLDGLLQTMQPVKVSVQELARSRPAGAAAATSLK